MEKPTLPKVETLITKIFKDRIAADQLSNCPLTMEEIESIRTTFLRTFKSILHSRLDYQDELNQMIEQTNKKKQGNH